MPADPDASQDGGPGHEGDPQLEATAWELVTYDADGARVDVPDGVRVTARFGGGRLVGRGGCNRYTAECVAHDGDLRLGPAASTLMACQEPAMSVEAAYHAALGRARGYALDAARLVLTDADGAPLLVFRPAQEPPLVGSVWAVTGVNNGRGGVVSCAATAEATVVFGEHGAVRVDSGCTSHTGRFTADGTSIDIGVGPVFEQMCPDDDTASAEHDLLTALSRATTAHIEDGSLELRDDSGALQVALRVTPSAGPSRTR